MPLDTLYYDGHCSLCWAEIRRLRRVAGDQLHLVDIHSIASQDGLPDRQVLLSRLHLQTADGQWLTGLAANVRAWQHTPYRRWWQVLEWPGVRLFASAGYEVWLRIYRWRRRPDQCDRCG